MKTRFSSFVAAALLALSTLTLAPAMADEASASAAAPAASVAAPAADAAAPAPAASASAAANELEVENPYGFKAMWEQGDFVTKATLIVMVIASMVTWYILITKSIDQVKLSGQAKEAAKFWKAATLQAGVASLKEGSPYRYLAETAIKASEHHEGALLEQIDLSTWVAMSVQRSVDRIQSRLQDGLAFLATVGSTGPFVGLLGTVWGIYHALTKISMSGQASIEKVAGPVGEALIMTAIGLAVAIPAVLGYNALVRRNKVAMEELRGFAAELHSVVLSGAMGKNAKKAA